MQHESIIDGIYEAAAFPDRWPTVLHSLGRSVDAMGAVIAVRSTYFMGFVASPELEPGLGAYLSSARAEKSQASARVVAIDRPGFIDDTEILTPEEWDVDPLAVDWMRPNGGWHGAATAILTPSGEAMIVHLHRRVGAPKFSRPDLDKLDSMRPHLARAALLSSRWKMERLRTAAEALALVGLPALILDRLGRVLAANQLVERMDTHVRWLPKDQVALADQGADAALHAALCELTSDGNASSRSFPARSGADQAPVIVHVVPTPGMARDLFDGAMAVVVITPLSDTSSPSQALIRGLFDLTPSEACAAQGIAEGLTIAEMARKQAVSHETVRTHVKAVLAKTGTRRQSETAALLAGIPSLPFGK